MLAIPAWLFSGRLVDQDRRIVRSLSAWDRIAVPTASTFNEVTIPLLNLLCVLT